MKHLTLKRVFSVLLALIMMISLVVPTLGTSAYAANGNYEIQIGETVAMPKAEGNTTWSTSNSSVASVSNDGIVTGVGEGTATITVTIKEEAAPGASYGWFGYWFHWFFSWTKTTQHSYTVTVVKPVQPEEPGTSFELKVGETLALPKTANGAQWSSSDNQIATVSNDGVVTGVKAGTVTVTETVKGSASSGSWWGFFWFFPWWNNTTTTTNEYTITVVNAEEPQPPEEGDDSDTTEDTFTVTFESNGGSGVEPQVVKDGEAAAEPDEPTRDGCVFFGWYTGDGYTDRYVFGDPVTRDITVYAKWDAETDDVDSDNDGLSDVLEESFGTNPQENDTDEDGVDDYYELDWLNTNPLADDTDRDGVNDGEVDSDSDGLANAEESKYQTNPAIFDTDFDGLSDGEEVQVYHTNPLVADTDGDGVSDGKEVEIGTDPLVADVSFTVTQSYGDVSEDMPVVASVSVVTDADNLGEIEIDQVGHADHPLLSKSIAGYLGDGFSFSMDGTFNSAEITMQYDTSLGTIGEDFQPRIYYFNEQDGTLEELPNQTVENGKVSVSVSHFSTYILLNKVEFDQVWDNEIKPPIVDANGQFSNIDVVFAIDVSGSMSSYSRLTTAKTALNTFLDALSDKDRAALVKFNSSASIVSDLTSDVASLKSSVNSLQASGGTSMYKGLDSTIDILTRDNISYGYKMIVVLSDGIDEPSTNYSGYYADLVEKASANDIVVYTVGAGTNTDPSILRQVAENTGGEYYEATLTSGITDAFADIQAGTVDLTTDSNNDGICDYYTELMNSGDLLLSTGSYELMYVTDMYGEDCDDWDGDGLKNGEEIQVVALNNTVRVKMLSNPLDVDSDGDSFTDDMEVKILHTSPLKQTRFGASSLEHLADSEYTYVSYAKESYNNIARVFDWEKRDETKYLLIDYFFDYASKDTIEKNAAAVEKSKKREAGLGTLDVVLSWCGAIKEVGDCFGEVGYDKSALDAQKKEAVSTKKAAHDNLNKNGCDLNTDNTIRKAIGKSMSAIEQISSDFAGSGSFPKTIKKVTDVVGVWTKLARIHNSSFKLPVGKFLTGMATKYQKYMGTPLITAGSNSFTVSSAIDVVFDVADGAMAIADIHNTFGKIKANSDAFEAYVDLLDYVYSGSAPNYTKAAAGDLEKIVLDTEWNEYGKQLAGATKKQVAITTVTVALDIGGDLCPYVKVVDLVIKIVKASVSLTGIGNNAKALVQSKIMTEISEGCVAQICGEYVEEGAYISYSKSDADHFLMYLRQLAQSRIVGEDFMKQRLLKGDLGAVISKWISGSSKEEIEDNYATIIGGIYDSADYLNLQLSNSLPYYSQYEGDGSFGGGSGGGGFRD